MIFVRITISFLGIALLGVFATLAVQSFFAPEELEQELGRQERTMSLEETTITWISDPITVGHKLAERDKALGNIVDGDYVNGTWVAGTSEQLGIIVGADSSFGSECTIWAYEPIDQYDYEYVAILGHEVLHCFWGSYHD